MPNFRNPLTGNIPERKTNFNQLIRPIHIGISGKFELSLPESLALRVRQPRAMCML